MWMPQKLNTDGTFVQGKVDSNNMCSEKQKYHLVLIWLWLKMGICMYDQIRISWITNHSIFKLCNSDIPFSPHDFIGKKTVHTASSLHLYLIPWGDNSLNWFFIKNNPLVIRQLHQRTMEVLCSEAFWLSTWSENGCSVGTIFTNS